MHQSSRNIWRAGFSVWCVLCALSSWAALPNLAGRSLDDAIAALRAEGLSIFYSTDLVRPDMRIEREPAAADPLGALSEILAPHGLVAQPGPQGSLLILRGNAPPAQRAPAPPGERPQPLPARPSLEEIVVAASRYELSRSAGTSRALLSGDDIEYYPDLGEDALRAVQRLPGTASNGFSAQSSVRGGEFDETLVRLDKLRLYNPFHLKNFQSVFSTVDPRIVDSMDVYTGGFPAAYGDRMSGVIDLATLTAPEDRYHEIALSFFNASALTSGVFAGDKGEWLASIRRSNLDLLYNAFSELPERPRYMDAFGKLAYDVSDKLRVTASLLYFADDITLSDDIDLEESSVANDQDRYYWLRLDHNLGRALNGATLVARASLDSDRTGTTDKAGIGRGTLSDNRGFTIDSVQSDWSWRPNDRALIHFGGLLRHSSGDYDYRDEAEVDLLFATPGAWNSTTRSRSVRVSPKGDQQALYGSLRYRINERIATDVGLRWDKQDLDPRRSDSLAPRIGLSFRLAEHTYIKASWGRFYQSQAINELQVEDGVYEFFRPQRSDHSVLGFEHRFQSGLELRLELYEKTMLELRPRYENLLNSLTLLPELKPDRIRIAPDRARARGAELLLRQRLPSGLGWWAGYSRAQVTDTIAGEVFYRAWDQTHALSTGVNLDTAKWNVSTGLIYRSGWPTTPVTLDDSGPVPIVMTAPRNSERVDFYRSVDIRLTRKFAFERSSLSAYFEVSNVFGRSNPCCTEYEIEPTAADPLELTRLNYLPFVPSLGFVWDF